MKVTTGKLTECFAFLPSLSLTWMESYKGNMYFLQFAWLYWYIECHIKLNKNSRY